MSDHGLTGLSRLSSDWLQYHYIPALAATCVLLAITTAFASKYVVEPAARSIPLPPQAPRPAALRGGLLALMVLGLGCYAWLMIAWEDFTFYDAHIFFQSLAGGPQYAPLQLFPRPGSAASSKPQEFYPLSFMGNSAQVYQVFSVLEILLLGGFLLTVLLRVQPGDHGCCICIAILLAPPIVPRLFHIVNSERNILLLLCIFLWSALRYETIAPDRLSRAGGRRQFRQPAIQGNGGVMMTAGPAICCSRPGWLKRSPSAGRRCFTLLGGAVHCRAARSGLPSSPSPSCRRSGAAISSAASHDPLLVLQVLASQVWSLILMGSICLAAFCWRGAGSCLAHLGWRSGGGARA